MVAADFVAALVKAFRLEVGAAVSVLRAGFGALTCLCRIVLATAAILLATIFLLCFRSLVGNLASLVVIGAATVVLLAAGSALAGLVLLEASIATEACACILHHLHFMFWRGPLLADFFVVRATVVELLAGVRTLASLAVHILLGATELVAGIGWLFDADRLVVIAAIAKLLAGVTALALLALDVFLAATEVGTAPCTALLLVVIAAVVMLLALFAALARPLWVPRLAASIRCTAVCVDVADVTTELLEVRAAVAKLLTARGALTVVLLVESAAALRLAAALVPVSLGTSSWNILALDADAGANGITALGREVAHVFPRVLVPFALLVAAAPVHDFSAGYVDP